MFSLLSFKYSVKLSPVCVQHLHMFDLCRIARIVYERQEMIGCFHILFSVFSSLSPIVGIVLSLQGDYQSS